MESFHLRLEWINQTQTHLFCQTCESKIKGKRWSPQTRKSIGQPERMDLREGENNVTSGTQRRGPRRTRVPRYWQSSGWDQSMDRLGVSDLGGKRAATSVSSLVNVYWLSPHSWEIFRSLPRATPSPWPIALNPTFHQCLPVKCCVTKQPQASSCSLISHCPYSWSQLISKSLKE